MRSLDPPGIGSLGSSDELFRAFTAHNPVGAFMCDAAGRCLYVNARWCELAGLTEDEALGDGWMRALHPDDTERVLGEWADAERGGRRSVVEYRFGRPDGEVSWIQRFAAPVRDTEGQITGWVGTCIDITDRHKRERQQDAVAQLGLRALSTDDAGALVVDAVAIAAAGLEVEYASFVELQADGETMRLRASYGWDGSGAKDVDAAGPSPAAQALREKAPVLVEHELGGEADPRSDFLKEHGVASSASIVVPGDERPLGALTTHSTRRNAFDQNDLLFLGTVGNVLAAALTRERTLGRLRRSEARYRDLFENATDLIATADLDSRLTGVNTAFAQTLGYTCEELVGTKLTELVPAEWHEQLERVTAQKLENELDVTVYEHELIAGDGRRIHVETASRLIVEDGVPVGTEAICRDVTERRRVEQALRESEERYRLVVENTDDLIALLDREGRILFASPSHEKLLGYAPEQLVGRSAVDFVHPDDRDATGTALANGSTDPLQAGSVGRARCKDGSWIYLEGSVTPLAAGDVACLTVARDVSARVRAEEALRESEERFRTIFEASPHGMGVVTGERRFVAVNAALERMLGYDKEELASIRIADLTHPDDRDTDVTAFGELISGVRESYELEKRYVRKDGSAVWVHLTAFRPRGTDGEPRFIGIIEDISGRKALEQQLRQSQKMEAVGQLAGGIAHDFNNLLTVINGYADCALGSSDVTKIRESLGEVVKAGTSAAALTRQLLAFSRKQVLQPRVVALGEVIANVERLLERTLGDDIVLETALDPELGMIRVDPNQIEQVLLNLAVNARDAMPSGGQLRIAAANAFVDDVYATTHIELEPGSFVELTVADRGVGMDDQTLSRVFEPFFTTKPSGTGLGLATVYGIVKQSGGHISLDSEPGVGTTFRLLFPLVEAAPEARPASSSVREGPTGTETILVVEDAEAVRHLIAEILETLGYTVATAACADEALDIGSTCEPLHLIISDVLLPGRSGPELVDELQRLRPGTKSIFTSGYAPGLAAQRGGLDPEQPFLAKPFTMAALASIVRDVLDS